MDRGIVYPGQIPLDLDVLSADRNAMIGVGYALQATLGTGTYADGLACLPTLPASMQVTVGAGSLVTMSTIDASAYGTIAADLDPLVKMGINPFGSTSFTVTAPGTSGQTINYLIEAQLVEADGTPIALPYYNASNPSQPFTGPNNSQAQQNTVRTQRVGLQLKAGSPAAAGTQVTPGVDAGWVGLYTITVNFAQTSITSTAINVYPGAPFIAAKIPNLAPVFNPQLTGTGTSPTPPVGDNSTRIATTAFVRTAAILGRADITVSGNFIVPAGVSQVIIRIWAGGGGSGGTFAAGSISQGGGGGEHAEGLFTVIPGQVLVCTVGAGGVAGLTSGASTGGNGGSTSVTGLITANGGLGGIGANGGAVTGNAAGGTGGTGGTFRVPGGDSSTGFPIPAGLVNAMGGGSYGTPPAHFGANTVSTTGANGLTPGGGATGSLAQANGGAGGNGLIIIEWG